MADQQSDDSANLQFPWKLHVLLQEAGRHDFHHIISWLPNGMSFKVHNKQKFAEEIMPKYFTSNKFKSFQRNLNLWGFHTQTKEPSRGAIYHPLFLRGRPDRCHLMKRVKIKKGMTIPPHVSNEDMTLNRAVSTSQAHESSLSHLSQSLSNGNTMPSVFTAPPTLSHAVLTSLGATQKPGLQQQPSNVLPHVLLAAMLQNQKPQNVLSALVMQPQVDLLCRQIVQASANASAMNDVRAALAANMLVNGTAVNMQNSIDDLKKVEGAAIMLPAKTDPPFGGQGKEPPTKSTTTN